MKHQNKIATCCYCGARSLLQLTARGGHELGLWLLRGTAARDEARQARSPRQARAQTVTASACLAGELGAG